MSQFNKPIVFINYRRSDTISEAVHLASDLNARFGKRFAFIDKDIRGGSIWSDELEDAGAQAKIILALIGSKWLEKKPKSDTIRLFEKEDWVRKELELAIKKKKIILPILIDDAKLPEKEMLPTSIQFKLKHQARQLRNYSWQHDMEPIVADIQRHTGILTLAQKEQKKRQEQAVEIQRRQEDEKIRIALNQQKKESRKKLIISLAVVSGLALLAFVFGMLEGFNNGRTTEQPTGVFIDEKDGKEYSYKKFGDQIWMTENLNRNINGSFCFPDDLESCEPFGRLYTWEAAQKACPVDWHLPTDIEWESLLNNMGGYYDAMDEQEIGNSKASYHALIKGGSSEFDALLAGNHASNIEHNSRGDWGNYWSASALDAMSAWNFDFNREGRRTERTYNGKDWAFSVRCVRD